MKNRWKNIRKFQHFTIYQILGNPWRKLERCEIQDFELFLFIFLLFAAQTQGSFIIPFYYGCFLYFWTAIQWRLTPYALSCGDFFSFRKKYEKIVDNLLQTL